MGDLDRKYIEELLEGPDCRGLLIKQEHKKGNPLWKYPNEQLRAMIMPADFANLDERLYIANMISRFLRRNDFFPEITEHEGTDYAERCLFSTSFFWDHLRKKQNNHGAPSPEFYLETGKTEYELIGMKDIARNMIQWREFLSEISAA